MLITGLRVERTRGGSRASARVRWEDAEAPDREVYLETTGLEADALEANPDAFVLGCYVPALHKGEGRIRIDGQLCPEFLEGLEAAMAVLESWYGPRYRPIPVEGSGVRPEPRPRRGRTATFLSGGVDSLATLRRNHHRYPEGHPNRIAEGFLLHGFDIGGVVERGAKYAVFDRARAAMGPVAADAGIRLVPVFTNFRHLCDERSLWLEKFFGSVLVAAAHGFTSRVDRVEIASSYDLGHLGPCGSHPLLDPRYGSADLHVIHRDVELTRIEKLRIVAGWPEGLRNLRVCLQNVPDRLNCGWCEKCVRTRVGLAALDRLAACEAFVESDVTAEELAAVDMTIHHRDPFYREMIDPLRAGGRDDLADVIEIKLGNPPQGQ